MTTEELKKTLDKLRNEITKSKKKIVKLKGKLSTLSHSYNDKLRREKIEGLIAAEEKGISLAEKEFEALVKLASTHPPVPHTVSNTEENSLTIGKIL